MSILGKDLKPEDILGMSQEDFTKKLNGAATKEDLEAIKGTFTSGLAELQKSLAALTSPKEPPPEPLDPNEAATKLLVDPTSFIANQNKPLIDATVETRAELEEMRARQNPKFTHLFAQYGEEMVKIAKTMPVAQRAQSGFWDWHIKTYLGHKMINGEIKPAAYPTLIGTSGVAPNADGTVNDPNKGFHPNVAQWLKDRKVPLEAAAKIENIMNRDGDPISVERYKSA